MVWLLLDYPSLAQEASKVVDRAIVLSETVRYGKRHSNRTLTNSTTSSREVKA